MRRIRDLIKKLLTPVTIMLVPHSSRKPLTVRVSAFGLGVICALAMLGLIYAAEITREAFLYKYVKDKLDYYTGEMLGLKATISSLRVAEGRFKDIFKYKGRDESLANLDNAKADGEYGSINDELDMEQLKRELEKSMNTVSAIRDYLKSAHDQYRSTPLGYPVDTGSISSRFGYRIHPIKGVRDFHSGLDLTANTGEPVKATADGVVSFAGYNGGSGNLVVLEHGFGYTTLYAHNSKILVNVGRIVKRGEIIAHVGSTGSSTGPHVHYEVWKDTRAVNPAEYLNAWKREIAIE